MQDEVVDADAKMRALHQAGGLGPVHFPAHTQAAISQRALQSAADLRIARVVMGDDEDMVQHGEEMLADLSPMLQRPGFAMQRPARVENGEGAQTGGVIPGTHPRRVEFQRRRATSQREAIVHREVVLLDRVEVEPV